MEEKLSISTGNTIRIPKAYNYKPKEDITVYELAQILPMFNMQGWYDMEIFVESLDENCKRHFEECE